MTNQEQYELICEKAEKYNRLVELLESAVLEIQKLPKISYPITPYGREFISRDDVLSIIDKYWRRAINE